MVLIVRSEAIWREYVACVFCPPESEIKTVTEKLPELVGVPEITPLPPLIPSPAGSPLADQVYGITPPLAATFVL